MAEQQITVPVRPEIANLQQFANQLLQLANRATDFPLRVAREDYLGTMTVYLLNMQVEHMQSVLWLTIRELDRDATGIARSMLEALTTLRWAKLDDSRAQRWLAYSYVTDWKLMQKQDTDGIPVAPEIRDNTEAGIAVYGDLFYTKAAKNLLAAGQPLPEEPFVKTWAPATVKKMLEDISDLELYELYSYCSNWLHGNVAGIGGAARREGNVVTWVQKDPGAASIALTLGFQSLFQVLAIFDERFVAGISGQLNQLVLRYAELHNQRPNHPE